MTTLERPTKTAPPAPEPEEGVTFHVPPFPAPPPGFDPVEVATGEPRVHEYGRQSPDENPRGGGERS